MLPENEQVEIPRPRRTRWVIGAIVLVIGVIFVMSVLCGGLFMIHPARTISRVELPTMPDMPHMPDLPQMPRMPDLPDLPRVPDLPEMPHMPMVHMPRPAQMFFSAAGNLLAVAMIVAGVYLLARYYARRPVPAAPLTGPEADKPNV